MEIFATISPTISYRRSFQYVRAVLRMQHKKSRGSRISEGIDLTATHYQSDKPEASSKNTRNLSEQQSNGEPSTNTCLTGQVKFVDADKTHDSKLSDGLSSVVISPKGANDDSTTDKIGTAKSPKKTDGNCSSANKSDMVKDAPRKKLKVCRPKVAKKP
ncbi:7337_t:CDS:2 [Acaulospora colombiana]|uniref:7337_t:CDS:1 n=1 Tax=Acaulospora colombiana TaxID=27376 RepID=A0ACA9K3F5_9GLOM|nr:7337_t:CDS:2 [Acaulospora colombiana]